ncbi:NAD(P)/FAD-dependent oxidoreductase [Roseibium aggregatum]|uniref:FAD-dependent oxidoreductase n=1 Tax=Roseibium aggregatum TaxID=187304 RepID=A0A926P4A6_9HYPH|nr:NAD(P)/FAD-dependent oxidoreductase [Roseibium aggregatum]MBD1549573.1 FAD-dependent oxidoreductase [Roseibium aggregatum]
MIEADLVIIGAGPAGMAAAAQAADCGLSVLILDEQPRPGGQIYRDVDRAAPRHGAILGKDYTDGLGLTDRLDHPNIACLFGTSVWQIDPQAAVSFSRDGRGGVARGKRLLIATGAQERPMPLPGWTLPGVMTAGAAQILLKASGVVAERAVLVGTGPLLYLVAAQMVRAGTPPLALVETQTRSDFLRSLRHLPAALLGSRTLLKGMGLLATLRKAGVKRYKAAKDIAVEGTDRVTGLRFAHGGQPHQLECDTVLLHHGVVPETQATRSLNLPHRWNARQRAFHPVTDRWGRTALPFIFVAGDGAGIGGAKAAAYEGTLAALEIARDLGALSDGDRDLAAHPLRLRLWMERAIRPFLDTAFPSFAAALAPADDTLVCRCEEVTAGAVRRYAALGCLGPNQLKAFGRPGMGPCQGRMCALTVTELLAVHHGTSPKTIGLQRVRPPLKPVTLGEIAAMEGQGEQSTL